MIKNLTYRFISKNIQRIVGCFLFYVVPRGIEPLLPG